MCRLSHLHITLHNTVRVRDGFIQSSELKGNFFFGLHQCFSVLRQRITWKTTEKYILFVGCCCVHLAVFVYHSFYNVKQEKCECCIQLKYIVFLSCF